jgi:hypothetical protein
MTEGDMMRKSLAILLVVVLFVVYYMMSPRFPAVIQQPSPSATTLPESQEVQVYLRDPDSNATYAGISKLVIGTDHGAYLMMNRSMFEPTFFNLSLLVNKTALIVRGRVVKGNITYLIVCIPEIRVQHHNINHSFYRYKFMSKNISTKTMEFVKNMTIVCEKNYTRVINITRSYIKEKGAFQMPKEGGFQMAMMATSNKTMNRTICMPDVPCLPEDLPVNYPACFIISLNESIIVKPIPQPLNITIDIHVDAGAAISSGVEAPVYIKVEKS